MIKITNEFAEDNFYNGVSIEIVENGIIDGMLDLIKVSTDDSETLEEYLLNINEYDLSDIFNEEDSEIVTYVMYKDNVFKLTFSYNPEAEEITEEDNNMMFDIIESINDILG